MIELKGVPADCANRRGSGGCTACAARPFSVCASIPDQDLALLDALASRLSVQPGEAIFHEGDPAASVYNVTSGCVRLSRLLADGRRQITGFLYAGDFVGLSAEETHGFTAEAVSASTLCRFRKAEYRHLMATKRELERALLAKAGDELAATQAQLVTLGRRTAIERLASFILQLPLEDPLSDARPGQVRMPMTRGEIADYLGLTIETVSRCFTRLKTEGSIRLIGLHELEIVRPQALRRLADGG